MRTTRISAIFVLVLGLVGSVSAALVAHYEFEGNASDSSGNNLHGTAHGGPTYVEGVFGRALDLDGVNDYVDCGNSPVLDITGQITLAAWVRTNDSGNGEHNPYITKGDQSFALKHGFNGMQFFIYDGGYRAVHFPVDSSFNSVWHHVAGTYDGSAVKLYIDGTLEASLAHTGSIASSSYGVNIGRNAELSGRLYEGAIDDVRIYNHALSEQDIQLLVEPPVDVNGFTYQGRLFDNKVAADGLYDVEFKLFDDAQTGKQVGNTIRVNELDVIDGYFTVVLDFPSNADIFDGSERWLQISVRPGSSTGSYIILSPRQKITPTPYAVYAETAGTALSGPGGGADNDWKVIGSKMYSLPSGNVGIGTTNPAWKLDVLSSGMYGLRVGNANSWFEFVTGGNSRLSIGDGHGSEAGYISGYENAAGENILTISACDDVLSCYGWIMLHENGNVNIGGSTPAGKLHVETDVLDETAIRAQSLTGDGVYGQSTSSYGVYGSSSNATGVYGRGSASGKAGVYGVNNSGYGVHGLSSGGQGVFGQSTSSYGVFGQSTSSHGIHGTSSNSYGVYGESNTTTGVYGKGSGSGKAGVYGVNNSSNGRGVHGSSSNGYGGYFEGKGYFSKEVNIDTTGVAALRVNGDEAIWYDGTQFSWGYGGQSNYFQDPVGIGTKTPSEALDVNGKVRIRDFNTFGIAPVYDVKVDTNGHLFKVTSSKRYKNRIKDLQVDPDSVCALRPVEFEWKGSGDRDIGLIAEEVDGVARDLVTYDKEGRPDAVKYDRVALYLLTVVKAQQQKITALEETVAQTESLTQRLEALENIIQQYQLAVVKEVQP